MNLLIPLPLWKIFFKNRQAYLKSLENDYNNLKDVKLKSVEILKRDQIIAESIIPPIEDNQKGYMLVSSADTPLGEYLVRVQTFKLI
jgi:chorismate-pyruvate lyase